MKKAKKIGKGIKGSFKLGAKANTVRKQKRLKKELKGLKGATKGASLKTKIKVGTFRTAVKAGAASTKGRKLTAKHKAAISRALKGKKR